MVDITEGITFLHSKGSMSASVEILARKHDRPIVKTCCKHDTRERNKLIISVPRKCTEGIEMSSEIFLIPVPKSDKNRQ
jgi:hypothetical protein